MNKKSAWYIIGFMVAACVVFGTGVSVVHNATLGLLAKNQSLHRNRIICRAFLIDVADPSPDAYEIAILKHIRIKKITDGSRSRNMYERIDADTPAIGFDFGGMGFWDRINGIVVLQPDLEKIINIQFFDHKETPGLGARIEEEWFTSQFKGIPIAWENPLPDRIIFGHATAGALNRVDTITGATQTSMALRRFLNEELERIRHLKID
jgi:Na+-transporting NADH:ubiquinone oxidoreductase subunit C